MIPKASGASTVLVCVCVCVCVCVSRERINNLYDKDTLKSSQMIVICGPYLNSSSNKLLKNDLLKK